MNVRDILGSGAIFGPARQERGPLLELGWGGKEPDAITRARAQLYRRR